MNRKNLILLVCLFIFGATSLHAQISTVGSTRAAANKGASQWSVQISPQAGDTLLVGCDYAVGVQLTGVSDTSGDSFSPVGPEVDSAFAARAYIATNVRAGTTIVNCNAASGSSNNEIYVTEFKGVNPGTPIDAFVSLAGNTASAKGKITTAYPNELVWAYVVTGHATNASGWTRLSSYDGNLVTDHAQAVPASLSPSFPVTMGWTLVLVALEPVGSSGPGSGTPISVSVSPSATNIQVSQSSSFSASLQNDTQNKGVTWSLSGSGCSGSSCGTLSNATSSSVTYTAPPSVPSPAAVQLTATSITDSTKSASATITVTAAPPPISVSVNPATASVQASQSAGFTASVQNDSQSKGVSWSLSGSGCSGSSCGTLTSITTSSATYNAPASPPSPATVALKATSIADSTKSASTTITVTAAPQPISVSINPTSTSVQTANSSSFTAAVQNDSQNNGVSWSLSGSGCSGSACGTLSNMTTWSATYTAPATAPSPATVTLKATSITDTTKSASASMTVTSPSNTGGSTPTLVWSKSSANTTGDPVSNYITNLPTSGTLPGNALLATFQFAANSASSASVSDDQGDVLALLASSSDGNQVLSTFCVVPTAGARVLTLSFSGGSPQYVSLVNASEWFNVSCSVDSFASNFASSPSPSPGTLSTSSDGDLLFQAAIDDGPTGSLTWTHGASPWTLLSASSGLQGANTPQASQYQVQATHGSISPSLSMNVSDSWNSLAIALKPSSSGTLPAPGIHIVHLQEESVPPGLAGPYHLQFPSSGNLLITASVDTPNVDITGISDNAGNTHSQIGAPFSDGYTSGDLQTFYAANAHTSDTLALTFSMTGSPVGGSTFFLYDVSGASSTPYDSAAGRPTATAPVSNGNPLPGPTITPSTANGLVIVQAGVASFSLTGVSPGFFAGTIPNPLGQTNPTNQNNGWAFDFNTTATSRQYVWTVYPPGSETGGWASTAVAFRAQ